MAHVASIIAVLAIAGAVASWIVGAIFYVKTLRAISATQSRGLMLQAMVAWPFVRGRLSGEPAATAAIVNKALVGFFVCLIVAVSAISAATNLARIAR